MGRGEGQAAGAKGLPAEEFELHLVGNRDPLKGHTSGSVMRLPKLLELKIEVCIKESEA